MTNNPKYGQARPGKRSIVPHKTFSRWYVGTITDQNGCRGPTSWRGPAYWRGSNSSLLDSDLSSLFTVSSFNHICLRLRMPAQYPRQSPSSERMTRPGSP